jgi:putative ABC transport system permease protein
MTLLTTLLVALGMATVVIVTLVTGQFDERLRRDAAGIDLVVGAKGSPLQLVLSGVYHLDVPPGNIALSALDELRANRLVAQAVPISLGDSFRGFRIVGTEPEFLAMHAARFSSGQVFSAPMQAVLGARVAAEAGLTTGAQFAGTHGMAAGGPTHGDETYTVSGVLAATGGVIDRLVVTSTESIWQTHEHGHGAPARPASVPPKAQQPSVSPDPAPSTSQSRTRPAERADGKHAHAHAHAHRETKKTAPPRSGGSSAAHSAPAAAPSAGAARSAEPPADPGHDHDRDHAHDAEHAPEREVTMLLVRYASPLAAVSLPRAINASERLQAASPAFESARLVQLVGVGVDGLRAFGLLILGVAAGSVFVALFQALSDRRREMALMRLLGATPAHLFRLLLLEGLALTAIGVVVGLVLGHVTVEVAGRWLIPRGEWPLTGWVFDTIEWAWAAGALALGALASLWPAWRAARTGLADVLAET